MAQTALSAGGRSAARCSALKPEYDVPYMPTAPVHHGCVGQPRDHARTGPLLLRRVLVGGQPVRRPGAAHVDAARPRSRARRAAAGTPAGRSRSGRPCGRAAPRARTARAGRRGQVQRRGEPGAVARAGRQTCSTRPSAPAARARPAAGRPRRTAGAAAVLPSRPTRSSRSSRLVTHRLLGRLDGGGEERVELAAGDAARRPAAASRGARRPVAEGQEDLAAARGGRRCRCGPGRARPGGPAAAQPARVERPVGHHDDDARAGRRRPGRLAGGGSSRADADAADGQPLLLAEVRQHERRRRCARTAGRRDAVPMPPLQPRQVMPVPAPTAPSSGRQAGCRADARAAASAVADVVRARPASGARR